MREDALRPYLAYSAAGHGLLILALGFLMPGGARRLAKVYHFPGENENEAIAWSVEEVLSGKARPLVWPDCVLPAERTDPLRAFGKFFNTEGRA